MTSTSAAVAPTPAAPPADPAFLDAQRCLLLDERDRQQGLAEALRAEEAELAGDLDQGDTEVEDGFGEGASSVVDRDRSRVLRDQALEAVAAVDAALARIDAGSYGRCASCGETIPAERLEVLPTATLCLACKGGGLVRRRLQLAAGGRLGR
ncbi:MAG: TraR/DksA family transcriptional regulator [Acidimicrobiales bacterium]